MIAKYRKKFVRLCMVLIGTVLFLIMAAILVYTSQEYWAELEQTLSQLVSPLSSDSTAASGVSQLSAASETTVPVETSDPSETSKPSGASRPSEAGADSDASEPSGVGPSSADVKSSDTSSEGPKSAEDDTSSEGSKPSGSDPHDSSSSSSSSTNSVSSEERHGFITAFYDADTGTVSVLTENPFVEEAVVAQAAAAAVAQEENYGLLAEYSMIYYRQATKDTYKLAFAPLGYFHSNVLQYLGILSAIYLVAMVLFYFISRYISKLAVRPLEEAWQRERQFVADASHDLKTPMTVILANNSILRSGTDLPEEERLRWLDSTDSAVNNMRALVEEMLTLSEVESPEAEVPCTVLDLSCLVAKMCMQLESVAYEQGVVLEDEISPDLFIRGNDGYLRRIVLSLIENALKYEPMGGRVTVRLALQRRQAELTVTNAGSVILTEDLPHVFERFYRADRARSKEKGHGLGLAITKCMVEQMGGSIRAGSAPETGTTFRVSFRSCEQKEPHRPHSPGRPEI